MHRNCRMNRRSILGACCACIYLSLLVAHSEGQEGDSDWPSFLGPGGNNQIESPNLPTTWDETNQVTWKTAIHGRGWSSPVIGGDQIWMGTASEDGTQFFAVCVDKNSGKIEHDVLLFEETNPRFCHDMNSYASPTPVIEDGRVYMHFGSYGTACLDTSNADVLWSRRDLPCDHFRGPGSSPILYDSLLIVHYDGADLQYVHAFNKSTGETEWRVDRDVDYGTDNGDIMKAYSTPTIVNIDGRDLLISATSKACLAIAPEDGGEVWRVRFDEFSATARPVYDGKRLLINTGFGKAKLMSVRPDGAGDVTDTHVDWVASRNIGSKPTPLLVDDLIYVLSDQGIASCLDAVSGEVVWTERLGGQFSSSPLYSGKYIYFSSHDGETTVIEPGREYRHVATNRLDDGFMSSPAVSDGAIFLRSRTHLYRIENQEN